MKNADCEGKKANYLQIEYSCIPSKQHNFKSLDINLLFFFSLNHLFLSIINNYKVTYDKFTYDISAGGNVENNMGIIVSPGYPSYKQLDALVYRKIVVPKGYSINVWILDLNIKRRDANKE